MTTIRETEKSFIVTEDGYSQGYQAFIQGAKVYRALFPKSSGWTLERVWDWVERDGEWDILCLDTQTGRERWRRAGGIRVLEERVIQ